MDRLEPAALASAILTAPDWARIALSLPDPVWRERAADALAKAIVDRFEGSESPGLNQLALEL